MALDGAGLAAWISLWISLHAASPCILRLVAGVELRAPLRRQRYLRRLLRSQLYYCGAALAGCVLLSDYRFEPADLLHPPEAIVRPAMEPDA